MKHTQSSAVMLKLLAAATKEKRFQISCHWNKVKDFNIPTHMDIFFWDCGTQLNLSKKEKVACLVTKVGKDFWFKKQETILIFCCTGIYLLACDEDTFASFRLKRKYN